MKVETWLPIFPGFYETCFEPDDVWCIENWKEEGLHEDELNEVWPLNCYAEAWHESCNSIAEEATRSIEKALKGFIKGIKYERVISPREYNFRNDAVDVEVTLTRANAKAIKDFISRHSEQWSEYLKSNYTCYDGFISSYSNDVNDWCIADAIKHEHKLGAILQFILMFNGFNQMDLLEDIEDRGIYLDAETIRKELKEDGFYEDKPELLERWENQKKEREMERTNSTIFEFMEVNK